MLATQTSADIPYHSNQSISAEKMLCLQAFSSATSWVFSGECMAFSAGKKSFAGHTALMFEQWIFDYTNTKLKFLKG